MKLLLLNLSSKYAKIVCRHEKLSLDQFEAKHNSWIKNHIFEEAHVTLPSSAQHRYSTKQHGSYCDSLRYNLLSIAMYCSLFCGNIEPSTVPVLVCCGTYLLQCYNASSTIYTQSSRTSSTRCLLKFTDEKSQRPSKDQIMAE